MRVWRFFLPDIIFFITIAVFLGVGLLFSMPNSTKPSAMLSLAFQATVPIPFVDDATNALANTYKQEAQWFNQPKSLLLFTDPALTYNNTAVISLWGVMLFIADSFLGIFLVLAGYRVIIGGFGSGYTSALEELPRLISSFIGANISLIFAAFWITINNLLCTLMSAQVGYNPVPVLELAALLRTLNVVAFLLLLVLIVLLAFFAVQSIARLAWLMLLTVCLPILFLLLSNPQTRRYGQAGLQSYVTTVLVQTLQLTSLTLATKVVMPLVGTIDQGTDFAGIIALLTGIAVFWLALRIPTVLRQWSLQPVAESGAAVRTLLVTSLARLF